MPSDTFKCKHLFKQKVLLITQRNRALSSNQSIHCFPEMQSHIFLLIFDLNLIVLKVFVVLFNVFGVFVVIKTLISVGEQELSYLAVLSVCLSLLLLIISYVKSSRKQIVSSGVLVSFAASITWGISKYPQEYAEFFSHEISILWTLRNTSCLYRSFIRLFQDLVDCCKIHTIVSNMFYE